ncbi:hypothetical protein [Amedibacillus sp. YH-ame10]
MNKVNVLLETNDEKEYLVLQFDSPIKLDLTSDNSDELKAFFVGLLNLIKEEDVQLVFDAQGRTDLYADVSAKYVKDLNAELSAIQTSFPKEIK